MCILCIAAAGELRGGAQPLRWNGEQTVTDFAAIVAGEDQIRWNAQLDAGAPQVVSYRFYDHATLPGAADMPYRTDVTRVMTDRQQENVRDALGAFEAASGLRFVELEGDDARAMVSFHIALGTRWGGWASFPEIDQLGWTPSDVVIDAAGELDPGGYGYFTVLHEIGHAIGLKHPHDTTFENDRVLAGHLDSTNTTIMSYENRRPIPDELRDFDVDAIRLLYGRPEDAAGWEVSATEDAIVVRGGAGDDAIAHAGAQTLIDGRGGDDSLHGGGEDDVLLGGAGDDWAIGHQGDDRLSGGDGNDELIGGGGDDVIEGGRGADVLWGDWGDDLLRGGDGDDDLLAGTGGDRVEGGAGDDLIDGDQGHDALRGEEGHDEIDGGSGEDRIDGGQGEDVLWGGLDDDELRGGDGHDRLSGGEGRDLLIGGTGFDALSGGEGADVLRGGRGEDRLRGDDGADRLGGGAGDDLLVGGAGDDALRGGGGRDVLFGGQDEAGAEDRGADTLLGGRGRDRLDGGAGDDVLDGGRGADVLRGGSGDDVLTGGHGRDRLTGGAGADVFVFGPDDLGRRDTVTDWEEGDRIDVLALPDAPFEVSQSGDHLLLEVGDLRVRLLDVTLSQFDVTEAFV